MMNAKAIGAIVTLAIVVSIGIWISSLYVQRNAARADAAQQEANYIKEIARADGFKRSMNACKDAAAEQSKAVLALKADKDRLERELADARKAAAAKAKPHYQRAEEIDARKPAPGVDLCKSASQRVDEQLLLERGR